MEIRQLEYFLAIAQHGSMTAAAKELHVSQPSLSVSLKKLEEELGAPLFVRDGKRLALNDNGAYFAGQAEAVRALIRESREVVKSGKAKRAATINCALKVPLGNPGALLRGFYERHEGYTVRMGWADASLFKDETVDLEVFSTPIEYDDPSVIPLGTEDYVVLLPKSHPLADEPAVRLADLKDDAFVVSGGWKDRTCFNPIEMCAQAGFSPRIVCETEWFTDAVTVAASGIGCCIAGRISWLASYDYDAVVKTISDVRRTRNLYVRLSDPKLHPSTAWIFVEYLQDYLEPLFDACSKARALVERPGSVINANYKQ